MPPRTRGARYCSRAPAPPEFVVRFQQTSPRSHRKGRRGHGLLPLQPPAGPERGGWRPGPLRASASSASTRATSSARGASRRACSRPRRTTPSAAPTCVRESAPWPAWPREVARARAALARAERATSRWWRARPERGVPALPDARRRLADRSRAPAWLHAQGTTRGEACTRTGSRPTGTGRRASSASATRLLAAPHRSSRTSSRSPRR